MPHTIAENLERLTEARTDIANAIIAKGGTVASGDGFEEFPYDIENIPLDQPWEPLEDGYSNFWVWLDNSTLTPQLDFSSVGQDATIDWGDGSGETALTQATVTHTYAKTGKYIIKVGGTVTLASNCIKDSVTSSQVICYAVEVSSDTSMGANTFQVQGILRYADISKIKTSIPQAAFDYNTGLYSCMLPDVTAINRYAFRYCRNLPKVTIPSTIETIGNSVFNSCISLAEIHCLPTVPPTLGEDVFRGIASDFIIYVPVDTGDTYKAASGWSAYADHIVEEGQSLSKAALSRIQETEKTIDESEVR